MPTLNQKRTAQRVKEVIESGKTADQKDILAFVGYGKGIQKNPQVVFKSKGFQEALKSLGFSIEAADLTVAKILRTGKEENQLKASDQIYKRLGAYEDTKQGANKVLVINLPQEVLEKREITNSEPSDNSQGQA